ncbi:hypothetical protein TNCV_106021 [Trichonephila clavipes]|nr:hypothetical protein TNCV_106021 [Trichonephila clavipes]
MRLSDRRLLCEIPVPFPDPFTCRICFNPEAAESLRRQGVFSSNGGYVRHLRNFHKIDPSSDVIYFCSVCIFKGTLKQVKSHRCPGIIPLYLWRFCLPTEDRTCHSEAFPCI